MSNNKKYPEHILEILRQRRGLDEGDTSQDIQLQQMSPSTAFAEVCQWEGLSGSYHETIKYWIEDIYGIDLDNLEQ